MGPGGRDQGECGGTGGEGYNNRLGRKGPGSREEWAMQRVRAGCRGLKAEDKAWRPGDRGLWARARGLTARDMGLTARARGHGP